MVTPTTRILTAADAAAWAALRRHALESHPLVFGAAPPADPAELVSSALARMAADDSAIFGAWADEALVGIVGVRRELGPKERHKAFVWGLYVSASHRRFGGGMGLLRAALEHARRWPGVRQVQLSVSSLAPEARRLYEREGFRVWGVEPRALCWHGNHADELHLVLDLREQGDGCQAPIGLG